MPMTWIFGAGGLVLLPPLPSGQQLLAEQGKQGTIYLLNTNNLGKYCVNSRRPAPTTIRKSCRRSWAQPRHLGSAGVLEWQSVLDRRQRSHQGLFVQCQRQRPALGDADFKERADFPVLRTDSRDLLQRQFQRHSLGLGWQFG